MSSALFYLPFDPVFTSRGLPAGAALAYFYAAGTTSLHPVYADVGLTQQLPNPVPADGLGQLPAIYVDNTVAYRVRVVDGLGGTIGDINPYIPGTARIGPSGPPGPPGIGPGIAVMPETFGARGDGVTNDTDAFVAMSAFIQARGGGVIEFIPGSIYVVGKQRFLAGVPTAGDIVDVVTAYLPSRICYLNGLPGGLVIRGNGARMLAAPGLRYGTFDTSTGQPNSQPMPYLGSDMAYPYDGMLNLQSITGPVHVENLELDGNCDNYIWGGQRGDTGWQMPGSGLLIERCANVTLVNVYSHHHGLDGLQCEAGGHPQTAAGIKSGGFTVLNSRFTHNCRLNGNLRAGAQFVAINCDFDFAAKGPHLSAPAAGFDLEAEYGGEPIDEPTFINCRFRHNLYQGIAADSGDTKRGSFTGCRFVAGIGEDHPVFISKPDFRFSNCLFLGGLVVLSPYSRADQLPIFTGCLFTDDPAWGSLDGTVNPSGANINTNVGQLMFDRCTQRSTHTSRWNVANPDVTFDACSFEDVTLGYKIISGTYRNGCRLIGQIDLSNSSQFSTPDDTCTLNGARLWRTSGMMRAEFQADVPALTAGAASNTAAAPTQADFNALAAIVNALRNDITATNSVVNGRAVKLRAANLEKVS